MDWKEKQMSFESEESNECGGRNNWIELKN
jgi:hypothetical protein